MFVCVRNDLAIELIDDGSEVHARILKSYFPKWRAAQIPAQLLISERPQQKRYGGLAVKTDDDVKQLGARQICDAVILDAEPRGMRTRSK